MHVGMDRGFRISPDRRIHNRSPVATPSEWSGPEDYPVFAINVNATAIGTLRNQWFRWLNFSERKKQAIRDETLRKLNLELDEK